MPRNIALCGPEERFNLLTKGIKRTSNVLARRHDRCGISYNERFSASRHGIAYSGPVRRHGKGQECRSGYRSRESILRVYRAVSCGQQGRGSSLGRPASWEQT